MAGDFPVATVKKLMKKAGIERASDEAAETLADSLNEIGFKISKKAVDLMYHAKRRTVTKEDIRLAASQ